jgi:hypothetical protein
MLSTLDTKTKLVLTALLLWAAKPIAAQHRYSGAADVGMALGSARVGSVSYGDFLGGRAALSFRSLAWPPIGIFDEAAIESVQSKAAQTHTCPTGLVPPGCLSDLPVIFRFTGLFGVLVKRPRFEGRLAVGASVSGARRDALLGPLAPTALVDGVWFFHPKVGVGLAAERTVIPRNLAAPAMFLEEFRLTTRYRWP